MSSTTPDRPADPTPATPDAVPEADRGTARDAAPGTPEAPAEPEEHLLVDPARVRRAPKFGAFFTVGVVVGLVAGLWLGTRLVDVAEGSFPMLKPGVFVVVVVAATTTVTTLLAGLAAVVADRRSLRGR